MSERFVRGWKVDPAALAALVGKKRFDARAVLASKSNAKCLEDVLMTLGDGDEDQGETIALAALDEISSGKLRKDGDYPRVLELLLNHLSEPLCTKYSRKWREPEDQILLQLTYAAPNDTFGRWNPLLKALRLPKLAKAWMAPNVVFPFARGRPADWPAWTRFDAPTLPALSAELATVTKAKLAAMPAKILSDEPDDADACRHELEAGLARLARWIEITRKTKGRALMLLMDGDQ